MHCHLQFAHSITPRGVENVSLLSVSVAIEIILSKLLLFVTLNVFLANGFFNATLDPSEEVSLDLFSFNIFIEDKLKLDLLRQLIELEFPVVAQVW